MPNPNTFPFITSIKSIIEPNMLKILLRGFSDEIKQAIIFVSSLDDDFTVPDEDDLNHLTCNDCVNFMKKGDCRDTRQIELSEYLLKSNCVSYYYCKNGKGGIHFEYPIFIDGLFCGLLLSGTCRFEQNYEHSIVQFDIDNLNNNFNFHATEFVSRYHLKWYDDNKNNGEPLTFELFVSKKDVFFQYAQIVEELLNKIYVGKIRSNNRESIKEIFMVLSHNNSSGSNEYGEEAYKKNFRTVIKRLRDILLIKNIFIYDNFISDKGENIFTSHVSNEEEVFDEIKLVAENFNKYFEEEIIFFWEPKNQYTKTKYKNEKDVRKQIYQYISDVICCKPSFLVILPIIIHKSKNNTRKVFILFYDNDNIIPYGSENLEYYFRRLNDIFRFVIRNYYDQIRKERFIMRISHDSKGKAGVLYTLADDAIRHLPHIDKNDIRIKLEDIKKTSDNIKTISNELDKLARSDYENTALNSIKVNYYKDIYLPLFYTYKKYIEQKKLYFDCDGIHNMPVFYSDFHSLFRVTENLFTNIIKYSVPNTIVGISFNENEDHTKFLSITYSNVTVSLPENEIRKIEKEKFRGSNRTLLKSTYAKFDLPEGKGLGIKIIQELLAGLSCKITIQQLPLHKEDFLSIESAPDFFIYKKNVFSRFVSTISINIKEHNK